MQPTPPAGPRGARGVRGGNAEVAPPPRPNPGAGRFRRGAPSSQGRGGQVRAALSIQRVYRGHVGRWAARMAIDEITDAMQYESAPEPDEEVQDWGGERTLSGGWRVEAERYARTDDEEEAAERSRVSARPSYPQTSESKRPRRSFFQVVNKWEFVKRSLRRAGGEHATQTLTPQPCSSTRRSFISGPLWTLYVYGPTS
jgi:hypothetical protein